MKYTETRISISTQSAATQHTTAYTTAKTFSGRNVKFKMPEFITFGLVSSARVQYYYHETHLSYNGGGDFFFN